MKSRYTRRDQWIYFFEGVEIPEGMHCEVHVGYNDYGRDIIEKDLLTVFYGCESVNGEHNRPLAIVGVSFTRHEKHSVKVEKFNRAVDAALEIADGPIVFQGVELTNDEKNVWIDNGKIRNDKIGRFNVYVLNEKD